MKTKLAVVTIIGIALIFIISIAGCGSVTAVEADAGSAGTGTTGTSGAAGTVAESDASHDVFAMTGAAGIGPTRRPLGAGCSVDAECGSGICTSAGDTTTGGTTAGGTTAGGTKTCCSGRSDTCNTCVGGYKTPVPNGPVTCGVCENGMLQPLQDGTACGTSTCGGTEMATGENPLPPPGTLCQGGGNKVGVGYSIYCYYPTATNSTCHAGVCVAADTDCTSIVCPAGCTKRYSACYINARSSTGSADCRCVDTALQICST